MKNFPKKILLVTAISFTLIITAAYGTYLYAIPAITNSHKFSNFIQQKVYEKTQTKIYFKDLTCKTYPDLTLNFTIKQINLLSNNNNKILNINNAVVNINPLNLNSTNVEIDYLFLDKTQLPLIKNNTSNKLKFTPTISKLPSLKLNKANVTLSKSTDNSTELSINNLTGTQLNDQYKLTFTSSFNSKLLQSTLTAGQQGYLSLNNHSLNAENFQIKINDSSLILNGKLFDDNKLYDFHITGNDLPINSLEKAFLFYIKHRKSGKNFIENFYDFGGLLNLSLRVSNSGLYGNALINNLSAKTVKFSIPIILPHAKFKFRGNTITASALGTFGNEAVYTDFALTDLYSRNRITAGNVKSTLTKEFARTYIPDTNIEGIIDASVKYQVQNGQVNVEYLAEFNKGSDFYYKNARLGYTDQKRRIHARTLKKGNDLSITDYDYSLIDKNKIKNIIVGDGLFVKQNGKFNLYNITCKTNGDVPLSVIGSLGKFIQEGSFNGNLYYYHQKKLLKGNFNLKSSKFKDFVVRNASIQASDNDMIIKADGTYLNSPFTSYLNLKNEFENQITIYDLKLYLGQYVIKRNRHDINNKAHSKIPKKPEDITLLIKNGNIKLDKLIYKNITLTHLDLTGSLVNGIVQFTMPDINFADGKLGASGIVNLKDYSSDINFSAYHVDSNLAAGMIFGLNEQIEGYANATMHLKTYNKLEKINAHTEFSIEDGALTKIGSTEFIIKKSKKVKKTIKFKLSDITNIDINRMKALKSNIKGAFDIDNHRIKNIQISSKHQYLSLYTEGGYNMHKQHAHINLWGRYNRNAQKGIKILFIPLSMITKIIFKPEYTKELYSDKIDKIPQIHAKPFEEELFTVRMTGNINDNTSIKVELKSIR